MTAQQYARELREKHSHKLWAILPSDYDITMARKFQAKILITSRKNAIEELTNMCNELNNIIVELRREALATSAERVKERLEFYNEALEFLKP